jgi:hypothetical protein
MANKFFSFVSHDTGNFSSVVSYTTTESYAVYCIPENLQHCNLQRRRFSSVVSHIGRYFPLLWDSTEEVFFRCGIQWKKLSSVVGYNGRGFFSLWDTTEEVFFLCGIQWIKMINEE